MFVFSYLCFFKKNMLKMILFYSKILTKKKCIIHYFIFPLKNEVKK